MRKLDLTGQKFGKLTVVKESSERRWKRPVVTWECVCDCGNTYLATTLKLRAGELNSCGCLRKDLTKGDRELVNIYYGMIARCNNPEIQGYHNYGGRGITVCPEWLESFEQFCQDMGKRPEEKSLDRINNNGNYCKDNCRWSTQEEQARNTRSNVYIKFDGESKLVIDWAKELYVPHNTITTRVKKGLPPEACLFGNDPIIGVYHEKKNKKYRASGRKHGVLFIEKFDTQEEAIKARLQWEQLNNQEYKVEG